MPMYIDGSKQGKSEISLTHDSMGDQGGGAWDTPEPENSISGTDF
jgi:hypothetical protein